MTRIEIERKPERPLMPLLLALAFIALVALGLVLYLRSQGAGATNGSGRPMPSDSVGTPPARLQLPDARGGESNLQTRAVIREGPLELVAAGSWRRG